jgi:hypothetical protein
MLEKKDLTLIKTSRTPDFAEGARIWPLLNDIAKLLTAWGLSMEEINRICSVNPFSSSISAGD